MKTFWLTGDEFIEGSASIQSCTSLQDLVPFDLCAAAAIRAPFLSPAKQSLVDWITTLLVQILKQVAGARPDSVICALQQGKVSPESISELPSSNGALPKMVLDEVKDIIELRNIQRQSDEVNDIELPIEVTNQMTDYVVSIASGYNDNPFHNFFHASQVCMSVHKLLSRIVAPTDESTKSDPDEDSTNHSFGITSDPLVHLAIVMSALIHDVGMC